MNFIIQQKDQLNDDLWIHAESFLLVPINWNDQGYKTQYSLFHLGNPDSMKREYIGSVKILKINQKANFEHVLVNDFESLDDSFISLGQTLDYYQRIAELPPQIGQQLLTSLNDTINNPELKKPFVFSPGWHESIFREVSDPGEFSKLATSILNKNFKSLTSNNLEFSFKMSDWDSEISFKFGNEELEPRASAILTNRIISIIGRNGSGKSTLLSRIARVAHASEDDRQDPSLAKLGTITPPSIGFPRIITISYSPFDSFKVPGIKSQNSESNIFLSLTEKEKEREKETFRRRERNQIVHEMNSGTGRFVFCGLRDIAKEAISNIENTTSLNNPSFDREIKTSPRPLEAMAGEFSKNLKKILLTDEDADLFDEALQHIEYENTFGYDEALLSISTLMSQDIENTFMSWSTGHKIAMQMLASLVAHTTQSSLVLIDEPETHLHPPLLAALMHAIRNILDRKKAFAIIATHSPIILQETLRKSVYIINRDENTTEVKHPEIETFGESIGSLTTQVFELNSRSTDFYKTLRTLSATYSTVSEVEALFVPYGMSPQARAFVIGCFAKRKM